MFCSCFKLNLRQMLRHKEFLFAVTIIIVPMMAALLSDLVGFLNNDVMYQYPAWYYWGTLGTSFAWYPEIYGHMDLTPQIIQTLLMIFMPFAAALAFSSTHYDNVNSGVIKQLLPRVGVGAYYRSTACTVFLGGFLVVFLPLLLEQIVLCLAFPWQIPTNVASVAGLDDYIQKKGILEQYAALQMNFPYLYNLLLTLAAAVTAGTIAYCSFSLSLFFQRSRFVVLTLPGILLWLIPQFALMGNINSMEFYHSVLELGFQTDFLLWGVVLGGMLLSNVILTELKIRWIRDEL